MGLPPLPIDEVLGPALAALASQRNLALLAPPGAGKTTRLPPAVLDAGLADKNIYVLQPRRLAARMAATRVATERGQRVGETYGYEVRFDRKVSAATRVRFVTEGVLLRKLAHDPKLADASVIVIDEFHERHLAGDLALAMVRQLARTSRPELRIAVMSATLDPGPVARFLGDCPIVQSQGRTFPVAIEYRPGSRGRDELPLARQVSGALRELCREGLSGDVLVFLPGAAEIRRATEACADIARIHDLALLPLHGDLPAAEQDRAVAPARRRKVILATNVAETSITIDGVVCVIDSGLARVARHSPWSGLPALRVEPISQASAAQRAGRAGRTRAGRCIRLYHQHDHDTRRPFEAAEVARADLADAALLIHASGVGALGDFAWFQPPPEAAIAAADQLLGRLGAIDDDGALTDIGHRMLRLPAHPRQARMLIEAETLGVASDACTLVALLGHRELRLGRRTSMSGRGRSAAMVSGPSDLLEDLEAIEALGGHKPRADTVRAAGLDPSVFFAVQREASRLRRLIRRDRSAAKPRGEVEIERALLAVTLAGYPDRVARRRTAGGDDIVLAGGGSAVLAPSSVVREPEFLVALDAEERGPTRGRGTRVLVHRASAVDPAWLFDMFIDHLDERDELAWNPERRRVERLSQILYDGLVIDDTRDPAAARQRPEEAAAVLAEAALTAGIERFVDRAALSAWRARVTFAAGHARTDSLAAPTDEALAEALRQACQGLVSFAELERLQLLDQLTMHLGSAGRAELERLAPTHVRLPGRRRVPVHYELDRPPWLQSRLQDFFGLQEGPQVAGGRVPVVLHLLAPNRRAVQVTTDLAGFWTRHYPDIRKQLKRRYPKHAWPEDPQANR